LIKDIYLGFELYIIYEVGWTEEKPRKKVQDEIVEIMKK
jgi:hypothetical protein